MLLASIHHLGICFGTLFSQSTDLPCCWPDLFYLCRASSFFEAVWKCLVGQCILLFCSSDTELLAAISSFNNNNYNHNAPTLNCSNNEIIIAKVWMKLEIHYLVWTGRKILPSNYVLKDYLSKFKVQYENFTCSRLLKIIATLLKISVYSPHIFYINFTYHLVWFRNSNFMYKMCNRRVVSVCVWLGVLT